MRNGPTQGHFASQSPAWWPRRVMTGSQLAAAPASTSFITSKHKGSTMNFESYTHLGRRIAVMLFIALSFFIPVAETAHAAGVVGNGTSISCTEAALTSALAGGGTITFNCGGPTTILVLSEKVITQNT